MFLCSSRSLQSTANHQPDWLVWKGFEVLLAEMSEVLWLIRVGWPNHEIYRYLSFSPETENRTLSRHSSTPSRTVLSLWSWSLPYLIGFYLLFAPVLYYLSIKLHGVCSSPPFGHHPKFPIFSHSLYTRDAHYNWLYQPFTDQLCLSISLWYWHSSLLHYLLISAEMSSYKKTSSDNLVLKSLLSSSLYVYLPSLFLDVIHTQCLMSIIYSLLLPIRLGVLRQMLLSCRGCYILSTCDHTVVLLHLFIY